MFATFVIIMLKIIVIRSNKWKFIHYDYSLVEYTINVYNYYNGLERDNVDIDVFNNRLYIKRKSRVVSGIEKKNSSSRILPWLWKVT
jgi:hypothetical protein